MDVVVADIPPKYRMLLSRSRRAKLQGSLQLDMSYATIFVFWKPKSLYRETFLKYVVSSQEKPQNFPIYAIHSDMDSFILFNDDGCPPTDDKPFILEWETYTNEKSIVQNLETIGVMDETTLQDKSYETQESQLPTPKINETSNTVQDQEIL